MPSRKSRQTDRPSLTSSTTTSSDAAPASRSPFDTPLPHALDAERAVLGAMLREPEAIGEAISVLQQGGPDAFFHRPHQELYDFIVELYDHNKSIDGVVIKDELVRRGLFDKLGGYDFLTGLISAVPSALRVREYAQIVLNKQIVRQLVGATHRVMDAALRDERPTQEVLDFAEQTIFSVTEKRVTRGATPLSALVVEAFRRIEQRGDKPLTGEPTGYYKLDEITCGLQPGELIVVAARPSMGKTALGLNMAEHMAIVENRPVLFFSLEMSEQQLAQRVLCSRARVDSHRLRRGMLSGGELARLQRAADDLMNKPLYIDETSNLSVLELRARARMMFRRHKLRAIFVDYLQLMHCPGSESRQVEVASISRGLKALAKELNVPVVAMAQLNRSPEDRSRQGNRPRMSDLRESGAIEQDADVVMLLHREDYFRARASDDDAREPVDEQRPAELIIAKQRNGPTASVLLHFNKAFTRFDNLKVADDSDYAPRRYDPGLVPEANGIPDGEPAPF